MGERSSWTRAFGIAACVIAVCGLATSSCHKREPAEESVRMRPYEVLDVMHQFQTYADKLYFSGRAGNWELAGWYLWKLEAAALPVIEGRVEPYRTETYDAQPLMKAMLIPALRQVEQALDKHDDSQFLQTYEGLVKTCNACHVAVEHPFVKIIVPTAPIYSNQNYQP